MENGRVNCVLVTDALREYWKEDERLNSGVLPDEGLRHIDPTRAMKLEMKWIEQVQSDTRLKMKRRIFSRRCTVCWLMQLRIVD
jgi:hypothetical protein